jgi:hypothetical protein
VEKVGLVYWYSIDLPIWSRATISHSITQAQIIPLLDLGS